MRRRMALQESGHNGRVDRIFWKVGSMRAASASAIVLLAVIGKTTHRVSSSDGEPTWRLLSVRKETKPSGGGRQEVSDRDPAQVGPGLVVADEPGRLTDLTVAAPTRRAPGRVTRIPCGR